MDGWVSKGGSQSVSQLVSHLLTDGWLIWWVDGCMNWWKDGYLTDSLIVGVWMNGVQGPKRSGPIHEWMEHKSIHPSSQIANQLLTYPHPQSHCPPGTNPPTLWHTPTDCQPATTHLPAHTCIDWLRVNECGLQLCTTMHYPSRSLSVQCFWSWQAGNKSEPDHPLSKQGYIFVKSTCLVTLVWQGASQNCMGSGQISS